MTAKQVADMLGYTSTETVYAMVRDQGLPFYRMGKTAKRFSREKVQRWLDAREAVRHAPVSAELGKPVARAPLAGWDGKSRLKGKLKAPRPSPSDDSQP